GPLLPSSAWIAGRARAETQLPYLKVDTVKRRTRSLFRQGPYWYHAIPNMRREGWVPLMAAFDRVIREQAKMAEIFGLIGGDTSDPWGVTPTKLAKVSRHRGYDP
ncbi:hypothetical protein ACFL5O_03080, partial [Myxococcota bacterium]